MENQHRMIAGYRDLSASEVEAINHIKTMGIQLGELFDVMEQNPDIDKRWLAIAKTDMQRGCSAIIRAIARPTTFA
ncbi:DUF7681 family protein [Burkholderia cepacia]|uniref:Acb2/Tad1 hairpin domain-containing protein n=1 Tax=Burkholderia cepacia TaxID=292 RepID=A0AAX2RVL7_BURCE|nr:hypothetical protein [Burkholderia cepacia]TET04765.1 hypothetical protein E3D36_04380 [Burkholderia cepacia]TEU51382.1 hypothetical protein E3D37_08160 [Burkholderia cepacia]TEU55994.1 hypothetical protein E3D38_07290 [Burkholderia cepacia]TEV01201.1 hypothetical protein E3D40_14720 [Burkholderia cepacia]TEV11136.1 hypothetical protein E3D44_08155 [Burkholderia cepacia]